MKSTLPEDHPWNPKNVPTDKLQAVWKAATEKAEELFEEDEDGDLPIDIRILDRSRFQPYHHAGVPYSHHAITEDDHDEILRSLMSNLAAATDNLETYARCREGSTRCGLHEDTRLVRQIAKTIREAYPNDTYEAQKMLAVTILELVEKRRWDWT